MRSTFDCIVTTEMNTVLARERGLGRLVACHSLGWLVAANLVGLWLAALLVWPDLGNTVAPLTYGRWLPLHLDWMLYGWCALPLVGVLMAWNLDAGHPAVLGHARVALGLWSLALALGGVAWLGGINSGKLFLEWYGWSRPLLPAAMLVLWTVLGGHAWWSWPRLTVRGRCLRAALLLGLLPVPGLLYWASDRSFYPSVNPGSGGATGAALLGSTLGIITIFGLLPLLLGLPRRRNTRWFWPALAVSWVVFAVTDHGDISHHDWRQIAGLAVLLFWVPALAIYWRGQDWSEAGQPWLKAALVWWGLLVVTGWVLFLPGVSERMKFTSELVAHSHLAMAGVVTCLGGLILAQLTDRVVNRRWFLLWQLGCGLLVVALTALGWQESMNPAASYRGEIMPVLLLGLRLAAGVLMTLASINWFIVFCRS